MKCKQHGCRDDCPASKDHIPVGRRCCLSGSQNTCGRYGDETVIDKAASREYVIDKAAWTETITVTDKAAWEEKVWKVDKAAWTETKTVTDTEAHDERVWVVDKKATTKTVVTGQRCETCGETKAK